VLNAAGAVCFLAVLAAAAAAARAERRSGDRRAAVSRFIAAMVLATFAAGLSQRDLWPFAKWPMAGGLADAAASNTGVRAVDDSGAEHDVDYRAWQPLGFDELIPWLHRSFARLAPDTRARVAAHLLQVAEQGRRNARDGRSPGSFERILGPATAPYFNLHPRLWTAPDRVPPRPFVALRLYRESWNQEERRRDPGRIERTLAFEYRQP